MTPTPAKKTGAKKAATQAPKGLSIKRRNTVEGQDPFASFTFVHRTSRIGNMDGSAVFEMNNVEVPDFWDQVATDILASKYFRKTGVPQFDSFGAPILDEAGNQVLGSETSIRQTALRMANAWRLWGLRGGYFASEADADAYRDEMAYALTAQMAAPNSPAWFNVGIYESYGIIQDPDGSWYFDPEQGKAVQSEHRYERAGVNACFPEGTRVACPTGVMSIEKIGEGDLVVTHKGRHRKVLAAMQRQVDGEVIELAVEENAARPITATPEHPFFCLRAENVEDEDPTPSWVDASTLRKGDLVVCLPDLGMISSAGLIELGDFCFYKVASVQTKEFFGTVYNIQVEEDETYVVEGIAVHNCFISAVKDQLVGDGSIFDFAEREARLFSQGSGSGANLSALRADGESLSAGGVSSGVLSFMKVLDAAAGAIKSGGATRRAAKMVILDADHPEVEAFVWAKAHEEKKAAALIAAGYESGYEGEAVRTVAFQNANHSVRITRGFMAAVEADGEWDLYNRTDGAIAKTIPARQLWREIAEAAWECADPGLQFDDILNDWNTVADTERLNGTNPCFPASARVHTDRGLISFGELVMRIQQGESFGVWTYDETNADQPTTTVTISSPEALMITGLNDVVKLTFSNGATLRCTPGHSIFTTNRGFVPANELLETDRIKVADLAIPALATGYDIYQLPDANVAAGASVPSRYMAKNVVTNLPEKWSPELAHLLGYLSGDGSICDLGNHTSVSWVYGSESDKADIMPVHAGLLASILGHTPDPVSSDAGIAIQAEGGPFVDFLYSLGFSTEQAQNKRVPETFFHTNTETLGAYLRGLFDANGDVVDTTTGSIELASESPDLLRDVQKLLTGFGIGSSITDSDHPALSITGESINRYAAHVGFSSSAKASKLEQVCTRPRGFYKKDSSTTLVSREDDGHEVTFNLSEPLNHSYVVDGIVVRNCSEYTHVDDTACNLASFNLVKFYDDETGVFDVDAFEHAVRLWTLTLEIHVSMSHYPARTIAEKSYRHRTLGLGYANIGALLMRAGLAYDSDEARAAMAAITSILHNNAYATSAEMARAVGPCLEWEPNKSSMARVLHNHRRAAYGSLAKAAGVSDYEALTITPKDIDHEILASTAFANLSDRVLAAADASQAGVEAGYRNMQVSVLAPTGCLVPDTLVTTDHGLFRLGLLGDTEGAQWQDPAIPGLSVLTDEGPRDVSKFYVNGIAEVVTITTEQGRSLTGTPEHRIKVVASDGSWQWRRLAEVKAGDIAPIARSLLQSTQQALLPPAEEIYWNGLDSMTIVPNEMTPELAEFIGYFQGDGSLHAKGIRLCVAQADEDVVKHLGNLGRDLFGLEATNVDAQGYTSVEFYSMRLARWFADCGFGKAAPASGKPGKGHTARIPQAVLATNSAVVYGAFLRGLFEADATVDDTVALSTAYTSLANDVRSVLTALGVMTGFSESTGGFSDAPVYRVTIRQAGYLQRFSDQVGFLSSRKSNKVDALLGTSSGASKKDWVPVPPALLDELIPAGHGSRPNPEELRAVRNDVLVSQARLGDTRVPRAIVERLYEATGDDRVAHLLGFFYDIVKIDAALSGSAPTYDLSVPDNVTYVANGFISHNTIGLVMDCDTTGIEPDFALVKMKKLAGGGYMRIINSSVAPALRRLGYDIRAIDRIMKHALGTQTLEGTTAISATSLAARGVDEETIARAESVLNDVSDLTMAFAPHVIGQESYKGLSEEAGGYEFLASLGFSAADIESSSKSICGHLTVEGAADLLPEHYAVFDCAVECGDGSRSIAWQGHVAALATVAPHISGSVSKTVNLPNSATVADIEAAHLSAYQQGVKCVAIYRDGSKVSQPLNSAQTSEDESDADASLNPGKITPGMSPSQYYGDHPVPRFRPPNPRFGPTWRLEIGGEELYMRVNTYEDGSPAEVFIDWGRQGTTLRGMTSALSIAISHALQRGMPLEDLIKAFRGQVFEPNGLVQGHENLKMASSPTDAVARILGHYFLGRDDMVQVPGGMTAKDVFYGPREMSVPIPAADEPTSQEPEPEEIDKARALVAAGKGQRLYDETCSSCGSNRLMQAGSCKVCGDCGTTTGCS